MLKPFKFHLSTDTRIQKVPAGYAVTRETLFSVKHLSDVNRLKLLPKTDGFSAAIYGSNPVSKIVLNTYLSFRLQFPEATIYFASNRGANMNHIETLQRIGFDGMVWKHSMAELKSLLRGHLATTTSISKGVSTKLQTIRKDIDKLDYQLLDVLQKRQQLVETLGEIKKNNHLAVIQPNRWKQVMEEILRIAESKNLDKNYIVAIMETIHLEAIRKQI